MKKNVLIIIGILATSSVAAIGYANWKNSEECNPKAVCQEKKQDEEKSCCKKEEAKKETKIEFFYDVDSRFATTITKENLLKAKKVHDLVPLDATMGTSNFHDVNLVLVSDIKKREIGETSVLTESQIGFLNNLDYSTDFNIEAFCDKMNPATQKPHQRCFVYYITVIPEVEAEYSEGHSALMKYLKDNSKKAIKVAKKDGLEPGKLRFTISKTGAIKDIELESTSGYGSIDQKMKELLSKLPGKWTPAKNANGENIEQELIFFFGHIGC